MTNKCSGVVISIIYNFRWHTWIALSKHACSYFLPLSGDNRLYKQRSGTAAGLVRPGISRPRVWIRDRGGGTTTKSVIGYNARL